MGERQLVYSWCGFGECQWVDGYRTAHEGEQDEETHRRAKRAGNTRQDTSPSAGGLMGAGKDGSVLLLVEPAAVLMDVVTVGISS